MATLHPRRRDGSAVLFHRSVRADGFRHHLGLAWQTDRVQRIAPHLDHDEQMALLDVGVVTHALILPHIMDLLISGKPPSDLAEVVNSWSCCQQMSAGPSGDTVLRLADGAWILYYQRATATRGSEFIISCGFDSAFRTSVRGEAEVLAIILNPWAGVLLVDDVADAVVRRRCDLTALCSWARPLRQRLDETQRMGDRLHAVWECLRAVRRSRSLPSYRLVREAIRGMDAPDGPPDITHLARNLGVSTRTLERHVQAHTGLPPKTLSRLRRLMKIVTPACQGSALDWAQLAAQAGFTDQSHLIREFGGVYGMTPAQFRRLVGVRGLRSEGYAVLPFDLNANATPWENPDGRMHREPDVGQPW